jgi:hypothetical protein
MVFDDHSRAGHRPKDSAPETPKRRRTNRAEAFGWKFGRR